MAKADHENFGRFNVLRDTYYQRAILIETAFEYLKIQSAKISSKYLQQTDDTMNLKFAENGVLLGGFSEMIAPLIVEDVLPLASFISLGKNIPILESFSRAFFHPDIFAFFSKAEWRESLNQDLSPQKVQILSDLIKEFKSHEISSLAKGWRGFLENGLINMSEVFNPVIGNIVIPVIHSDSKDDSTLNTPLGFVQKGFFLFSEIKSDWHIYK